MPSGELLAQTATCVDVTQSALARAATDYHFVSRFVTDIVTDVGIIDGYNSSAYLVQY